MMSQQIAELLARLAYHFLPPHLQTIAKPYHRAAVMLIASAIDEVEIEKQIGLLILRQRAAIEEAMRS
jgi:hypothetical protein